RGLRSSRRHQRHGRRLACRAARIGASPAHAARLLLAGARRSHEWRLAHTGGRASPQRRADRDRTMDAGRRARQARFCARRGSAAPAAHGALQRRAPDGRAIGTPISLLLAQDQPTVLVGASGSGKTSLLKQVAGWIGDDALAAGDRIVSASERRALCALVLHDAVILEDTVRANLFACDVPDAELWRALEAVEMGGRIRDAGGLDAWIRQDRFSLGEVQRINLARAWLSGRP